jgi:hypothetical protein
MFSSTQRRRNKQRPHNELRRACQSLPRSCWTEWRVLTLSEIAISGFIVLHNSDRKDARMHSRSDTLQSQRESRSQLQATYTWIFSLLPWHPSVSVRASSVCADFSPALPEFPRLHGFRPACL